MRRALIALVLVGCGGAEGGAPATPVDPPPPRAAGDGDAPARDSGEVPASGDDLAAGFGDRATRDLADAEPGASGSAAPRASGPGCPAVVPLEMACVAGGAFLRGDSSDPAAGPAEEVTVSTFLMDRHEVSNAEYAECVAAEVCAEAFPFRGFGEPEQPVVAMRWDDARAYCQWRDKRLPTEAEWERAARGPDNTRWPYGDERVGCAGVHVRDARGHGCGTEVTRAVGTLPAGHWGLHDMAGNVDEWVQDWFTECYRGCPGECGEACAGVDPRGPCGGADECPGRRRRSVRGGSWWWGEHFATGTRRRGKPPSNEAHHRYGFRCARDV
ncbi:MAG: hypothetical protein CMN30_10500 [Sandaracinus sp.]|nr:hypothetical protein [Sandaracinus sp.]